MSRNISANTLNIDNSQPFSTNFHNATNGIFPNYANNGIYCFNSGAVVIDGFLDKSISSFSNSAYCTILNDSLLNNTSGQIDIYIKPNDLSSSGTVIWKNEQYGIDIISGFVRQYFYNGSNYSTITSQSALSILNYSKITCQYAELNNISMFINGSFSSSATVTTLNTNTNNIFIGVKDIIGTKSQALNALVGGLRINNILDSSNKIFAETYRKGAKGKNNTLSQRIVFSSTRSGTNKMYLAYVFNIENPTIITTSYAVRTGAKLNYSRTKMVFEQDIGGSQNQIYTCNVDGSSVTLISGAGAGNAHNDIDASMSPDNTKIAYVRRTAVDTLYTMNADGTNEAILIPSGSPNNNFERPMYSPDGTKILYEEYVVWVGNDTHQLYKMNVDGSGRTNLSNDLAYAYLNGRWSPDGTKIVFARAIVTGDGVFGNFNIWKMDADGTNQTQLTNNAFAENFPTWSSDGSIIYFHTNRDGNNELYSMNADGTNQKRLTNNAFSDLYISQIS